jgi:hypothetical protein
MGSMTLVLLTGASGFLGSHSSNDSSNRTIGFARSCGHREASREPGAARPDANDSRIEVPPQHDRPAAVRRPRVTAATPSTPLRPSHTDAGRRTDAGREPGRTTTVLDAAIEAECRGIVHVSSTAPSRPAHDRPRKPDRRHARPVHAEQGGSERAAETVRKRAPSPSSIRRHPRAARPYRGESNQVVRTSCAPPTWPRAERSGRCPDTADVVVPPSTDPDVATSSRASRVPPARDPSTGDRTQTPRYVCRPRRCSRCELGYRTDGPSSARREAPIIATDNTVDYTATSTTSDRRTTPGRVDARHRALSSMQDTSARAPREMPHRLNVCARLANDRRPCRPLVHDGEAPDAAKRDALMTCVTAASFCCHTSTGIFTREGGRARHPSRRRPFDASMPPIGNRDEVPTARTGL